tara:strand:+ start:400 stop:771 length:372 start_codon:yes stop_codon:yes gene_type:complete
MKKHKHDPYDGLIRDREAERINEELFGDESVDLTYTLDADRPDDRSFLDRFFESPTTMFVWLVRASYVINVTYLIWAGSTNLWEIFLGSFLMIIVTFPALVFLMFVLMLVLMVLGPFLPRFDD